MYTTTRHWLNGPVVGGKRDMNKEDRGVDVLIETTFLSAKSIGSIVQLHM